MNNFLKHTLMSFIGVSIAAITVMVISAILNEPADNIVGWIALGIAGSAAMTKSDRY